MREEYRTVNIVALEGFIYVFVFFPFISYYVNHANVLYYHTKAILPYDFYYTFWNFYFCRAFIISLVSVDAVSIFAWLVFIEVEPDTLDVFSRFCVWVIHGVPISPLLVIVLVLAPLGSPIVGNYDDIVFCGFGSDEFDGFRFLFVQVG